LKLYLETSVWNFLFADDAPEKRDITKAFFLEVEAGRYDIFVSEVVMAEIEDAPKGNPTTTLAPIPLIFFCDAKGMKGGFSTDTISPVQGLVAHQIPA